MMQVQEQIAADFYPATKSQLAWVRVYKIENGQRRTLYDGQCEGRRHARQIAKQYNATPWNF